jgi:SAM-dependent methyltransferase
MEQHGRGRRRILDVAAGTGNAITKVHAPVRVALDLSPQMLAALTVKDPAVAAVVGLAEALPFPDEAFDLVIIYSAVHHLSDLSALAELARVARPGGAVVVDHEDAFQERGWKRAVYAALRAALRVVAWAWYWPRPGGRRFDAYRRVHWPYSASFGAVDFFLTDGGAPDPIAVEAEMRRLGLTVRRRHYLLAPLPMETRWQAGADALCRWLELGHFALEATR